MGVPLDDQKYGRPVLMTAADMLRHRRRSGIVGEFKPPEAVILCYQSSLLAYAVKKQRGKKMRGVYGDFYLLQKTERRIGAVGNFGVGAPVAAVLLEDLAALGVKRFFSIGVAGGVQETGQSGDLVIAEQALRDEGTSHHYLPPGRTVTANTALKQRLERALLARGQRVECGMSWTTDAPYRETWQELSRHREAGVLTVEMEAAALYAVAQVIDVEICAAFCIGDVVRRDRWQLDYDGGIVDRGLQQLFDASLEALLGSGWAAR